MADQSCSAPTVTNHDTEHYRISTDHNTEPYRSSTLSRLLTCIFVLTCFSFMLKNNCVSNCFLLLLLFPLYPLSPIPYPLTLMAMHPVVYKTPSMYVSDMFEYRTEYSLL